MARMNALRNDGSPKQMPRAHPHYRGRMEKSVMGLHAKMHKEFHAQLRKYLTEGRVSDPFYQTFFDDHFSGNPVQRAAMKDAL